MVTSRSQVYVAWDGQRCLNRRVDYVLDGNVLNVTINNRYRYKVA